MSNFQPQHVPVAFSNLGKKAQIQIPISNNLFILSLVFCLTVGCVQNVFGQASPARSTNSKGQPVMSDSDETSQKATKLVEDAKQILQERTRPNLERAVALFQEALTLWQTTKNRAEEARTLNEIGLLFDELGKKPEALEVYGQALTIWRETGNDQGQAEVLANSGKVLDDIGQKQKAIENYELALPLFRKVGDKTGEAITINNLGKVYNNLGEKVKALEYYTQALEALQQLGELQTVAAVSINLGVMYRSVGEFQKSLESYNRALAILENTKGSRPKAFALDAKGYLFDALGDKEKAFEYYEDALGMWKAIGNKQGEGVTLAHIGNYYASQGLTAQALDTYQQALALSEGAKDRKWIMFVLNFIGQALLQEQKPQEAARYHEQALEIARNLQDINLQAFSLNRLGQASLAQGDVEKALKSFQFALELSQRVGDGAEQADVLFGLAKVNIRQGKLEDARTRLEQVISLVETTRAQLTQEFRTSYFGKSQPYYRLYIDVLMQLHKTNPTAGYDRQAFQVGEQSRARSLLELLSESGVNIREGADPKLVAQETELRQRLTGKFERLARLLTTQFTPEQEIAAKKEIDEVTEAYRQVQDQIRATSPHYAALTQPQTLTVEEIQHSLLDSKTVLVEYALAESRSYAWVVTPTEFLSFELPKQSEIEALAEEVYQLLRRPTVELSDFLPNRKLQLSGSNLHVPKEKRNLKKYLNELSIVMTQDLERLAGIVLQPLAGKIGRGRVLIVPDGALQYIPFGCLPVKKASRSRQTASRLLVAQNEIVILPSASALSILRKETAGRATKPVSVAIVADPVFDPQDERFEGKSTVDSPSPTESVTLSAQKRIHTRILEREKEAGKIGESPDVVNLRIPRLPFTRVEADQISKLVGTENSARLVSFAANRQAIASGELSKYPYIHLATHGLIDADRPDLSALVFSLIDETGKPVDGYLRALDIYNLSLPAELVVLSACETGLGKQIKGEGMVGLTRGFMYAGAKRVIVSLWSVNDEATASLMTSFYRKMIRQKQSPAAALRAAQLEMLKNPKWKAPFYWAPFMIQGEFK